MADKPIILLVDDSPTNIQILAVCLKDDYHLKIGTSGEMGGGCRKNCLSLI